MALDSDLLRKASAGDHDAFDALIARHGRLVLGLARRIVGHREDGEDVAQEVFLRFYRTLDRVDPDRPLEPWLVRLTVNAARSRLERRPQQREDAFAAGTPAPPGGDGPLAGVERAEIRAALNRALAELPERERLVFLMRDLEGIEVVVIAEALGISDVTVRRQSGEARRKVGAWLRTHRPEMTPSR